MHIRHRRLALGCAILLAASPFALAQPNPTIKAGATTYFKGKVVPLDKLLQSAEMVLDPEAVPHWYALVTDDGKIYPLVRDAGAKMFFTDATVRNKAVRITGRLFGDTRLLQVLNVHSYKDGKLHDLYYWCDVCTIRRNAGGKCECCGGPMELRETPAQAKDGGRGGFRLPNQRRQMPQPTTPMATSSKGVGDHTATSAFSSAAP